MKTDKAIILGAGEGTRLKKYTRDLPKGMLSFAGKTIMERQIGLFREAGITDICVINGFAQQKITYPGIRYYINKDYASTNMVASLFSAEKELKGGLTVSYADILFEKGLLKRLLEAEGDIVVAVDIDWRKYWTMRYGRTDFDTESMKLDKNGKIISLGKKSPPPDEIDGRYIGLIKFSPKGTELLKEVWHKFKDYYWNRPWQISGETFSRAYMTDMLQALIDEGCEVDALKTQNGWIEFDADEDYEKALQWHHDGSLNSLLKVD